ncbi:MAG: hypothetical protein M0Q38_03405 [Bacteroidales bacterium]|jgi:hypothetical protein|nr:hypothetical protein [Bacteroidales bacterium]
MVQSDKIQQQHHKRRRSSKPGKSGLSRNAESIISKHLIKVLGIVFILASVWFASKSAGDLLNFVNGIGYKNRVIQPSGQTVAPTPPQTMVRKISTGKLILLGSATALAIVLILYASSRFHRREIPRVMLPVFYAFLVLSAIRFGWPTHMTFPLILFASGLLFWNGRQLNANLVCRINVLFAWGFMMIWWGLKLILGGSSALLVPYFIYSTLFYFMFYMMGLAGGFHGHHKTAKFFEFLVIMVNIFAYFLCTAGVLYKFGWKEYIWLLSLIMSIQIFTVVMLMEKRNYDRTPYLIPGIIILSLVFPILVHLNFLILFLGIFSVLLMTYSRFSENKWALIASLVSMTLMLGIYCYDWIFSYFPLNFLQDIILTPASLDKGLIASIFILPVIWINQKLIKDVEVDFSKKWFSRHRYVRLFKGLFLGVLYLACYWIFNYFLMFWLKNGEARLLSWFIFSCLYFLILMPMLARQKSSYLRNMLWISLLVSVAYPLLLHFKHVLLRNESLIQSGYSSFPFYFHYVGLFLLLFLLSMTGYYFRRTYKENPALIRGVWFYFILMGIFLLLSEFDHLVVLTNYKLGVRIEDLILTDRNLPYTIILFVYATLILILGLLMPDRFLRITAMILIAAAMVKMAYKDRQNLSVTGTIILFFVFGSVLLIFSFFYPKIRQYFSHSGHGAHSHHHHHSRKQPDIISEEKQQGIDKNTK